MKIKRVWIYNFRSIESIEVVLKDCLALVGPNSVGKSNILSALNLILGKSYFTYQNITADDFYRKNISEPIKIILQFENLSEDEAKYFRSKTRGYTRVKGGEAIRGNYSNFLTICLELPFEEQGKFYYVGEDHIPLRYGNAETAAEVVVKRDDRALFPQFLLVPSIRDAQKFFSDSKKYDWGKVIDTLRSNINLNEEIQDAVKNVVKMLSNVQSIKDFTGKFRDNLREFLTDDHKNADLSITPINSGDLLKTVELIIDDGFISPLMTKGNGVCSLAVIVLLLTAAETDKKLVIGLEEPELFIHPSALYVLNEALQKLCLENQLIYSSHSPFLINVTKPANIGRVYKQKGKSCIKQLASSSYWFTIKGEDEIERDIDAQRNLLFFANAVILIEGPTEYLSLPTFADKLGINLAKKGIIPIEVNGKPNLKRYSDYLTDFEIPHIIVYDIDEAGDPLNDSIKSASAKSIGMDLDFEMMLLTDLGEQKLNLILTEAYGDIFVKYKQHYQIKNFSLADQILKFLKKSKPFAPKYIAKTVSANQVPETIKSILQSSLGLIG